MADTCHNLEKIGIWLLDHDPNSRLVNVLQSFKVIHVNAEALSTFQGALADTIKNTAEPLLSEQGDALRERESSRERFRRSREQLIIDSTTDSTPLALLLTNSARARSGNSYHRKECLANCSILRSSLYPSHYHSSWSQEIVLVQNLSRWGR